MKKVYFIFATLLYIVILALRVFELNKIAMHCIPAFVLLTVIYSFFNAKKRLFPQSSLILTLALALAFCADMVINFIDEIPGAMIFFAVHACLVILYLSKKPFELKEIPLIFPLLAINALFYVAFFPYLESAFYILGIFAYLTLLTLMLWRAVCLYKDKDGLKIIMGSVLFFLTDISVIMMVAYGNFTTLNIDAWVLYPPALFSLSLINCGPSVANRSKNAS